MRLLIYVMQSQEKLFTESRDQDKLDRKGKNEYRASKTDENGDVYDELTGKKGNKIDDRS